MRLNDLPESTGLYNQNNEHDACGIGVIVNIKGLKSHLIIKDSLQILTNLEHRGGTGAEDNTGDGAGILTQIPHKFFSSQNMGFEVGEEGTYAVAFMFLSQNENFKEQGLNLFKQKILDNNLCLLGFREVPVSTYGIGDVSLQAMPYMVQAFIKKPDDVKKGKDFEVLLYKVRREIEKEAIKENISKFYFSSFSSKTIVYKGMLKSTQVRDFYLDLLNENYESALALVHSRFSTNTFPSWERAHPNRFMIHNGEINTIKGNVDLIKGREKNFKSDKFKNIEEILPVIAKPSSDSAMFDNTLEFLYMNGFSLEETLMMMIPKPWDKDNDMEQKIKDFYCFSSLMMEPWDGPASIVATDGDTVVASLDRNGLRPSRYYITSDDFLILSSETGALKIKEDMVIAKKRLEPGKRLKVDTINHKISYDEEIEKEVSKKDYATWLKELTYLNDIEDSINDTKAIENTDLLIRQKALGYKYDTIYSGIIPLAKTHEEATAAMGTDVPLAVLSNNNESLFLYFKQLFAQVTNPPIDSIREAAVTSTLVYLGKEGNLLSPQKENAKRVVVNSPIVSIKEMNKIKSLDKYGFKTKTIDITYNYKEKTLEKALDDIFNIASSSIKEDTSIIILSDRNFSKDRVIIPSILAVGGLNQHLINNNERTKVSIVIETSDAREIHHYSCLLGFGANVICPYLVYDTINDLIKDNKLEIDLETGIENYIIGSVKGIVKIISKMGISTIQAYNSSRIFEIIGLADSVTDKYFSKTHSKIGGLELTDIEKQIITMHELAYTTELKPIVKVNPYANNNEESHLYNPFTIKKLQFAVRNNQYDIFKEFVSSIDSMNNNIRNLFDFEYRHEISIDEVESVDEIVKRFKTGAMSYGSISKEAHEALAIAMNRIGGMSNTGEGGENEGRKERLENGDSKLSAIKQVASGRFGVTMDYLASAKEIQIKIAQGAKPGEGGQLPGKKVYPWIAKARYSTPGVTLISPPPHHDIYSIEDLAQLIYDLKNANEEALISVKLVSEDGVGTVASGVAKAGANVILISGYDGGTGASPRTSIPNAGMPWEIGLADAHQTLIMNDLRERVKLEVDGKLLTGRDLAVAILLGADEFDFATAPLVALGCVMARVCNLDTCPVGVATQNEKLRGRFKGTPEHVINFMYMIAQNLREHMARLGFRTINEMIGHSEILKIKQDIAKEKKLYLENIFNNKYVLNKTAVHFEKVKENKLEKTMDHLVLLPLCKNSLLDGRKTTLNLEIKNTNRTFGTILSYNIIKKYGPKGLADDTITINTHGHAGNSYGAFGAKGLSLNIKGDANDYLGKGLCGGIISVSLDPESKLASEQNIIAGNVILYGATSGETYIDGVVGERFAVRNSGAKAVVLGCGNHGCEYMTGGMVLIAGSIGINFAAGMSGGIAYVLNTDNNLKNINRSLVDVLEPSDKDLENIKELINSSITRTNSTYLAKLAKNLNKNTFVKVLPRDYQEILDLKSKYLASGLSLEEAELKAFYDKVA